MTRFFVQREAGIRETVTALAVAVGIGALSFYVARMLISRDDVESEAPPHLPSDPARRELAGSGGAK